MTMTSWIVTSASEAAHSPGLQCASSTVQQRPGAKLAAAWDEQQLCPSITNDRARVVIDFGEAVLEDGHAVGGEILEMDLESQGDNYKVERLGFAAFADRPRVHTRHPHAKAALSGAPTQCRSMGGAGCRADLEPAGALPKHAVAEVGRVARLAAVESVQAHPLELGPEQLDAAAQQ